MPNTAVPVETIEMPRPPSDSVQIAIRIPKNWLPQADEVAALISRPGFEASRTDAFRAAIAKGFEVLRAEAASTATPIAAVGRQTRSTIPKERPSKKR